MGRPKFKTTYYRIESSQPIPRGRASWGSSEFPYTRVFNSAAKANNFAQDLYDKEIPFTETGYAYRKGNWIVRWSWVYREKK